MSQFTTPAVLEMLDDYKWRLVEPFTYYLTGELLLQAHGLGMTVDLRDGRVLCDDGQYRWACFIDVPVGYVTDLTSTPRLLWSIFPPDGKYAKAAIVHDYLYSNAIGLKAWADLVFKEAMGVLNVPKWRRYLMYWAVRLFGRGNYGKV